MKRPEGAVPKPPPPAWRKITRRAFAAFFGLGAVAAATGIKPADASHKPRPTRWIGHC
jgi:hypothetical protein